jgi:hypothetical protein
VAAEIPDGAVIVARAILNSSLWTMRSDDRVVAMTCIALCNKVPKKWFDGEMDLLIPRGSFVRSWGNFVKSCGLPLQVVRTSIKHLKSSDFLTQVSTRFYTVFTLPKYEHYQDLTKYSDSAVPEPNMVPNTRLTTNNNRKKEKTFRKDGISDVVVPEGDRGAALDRICYRTSIELLGTIQMSKQMCHLFASTRTVGRVLDVVQQARGQTKPGGWARVAFESEWKIPMAAGAEVEEVSRKALVEAAGVDRALKPKTFGEKLPKDVSNRRPGEDERAWFKRVNDELKRRKEGRPKEDHREAPGPGA